MNTGEPGTENEGAFMKWSGLFRFALICMLIGTSTADAQFFNWDNPSSRSVALGGVETVGLGDPSEVVLNPAALTRAEQNLILTDIGFRRSRNKVISFDFKDSISNYGYDVIPNAGIVFDMNSRLLGIGIFVSTDSSRNLDFPRGGSQRYQVESTDFWGNSLDVGIGYHPVRDLAIGVSMGYRAAFARWERSESPIKNDPESPGHLDTRWEYDFRDTAGFKAAAGMIWSPSYRFELGLSYHPPLAYHFKTDLTVELPDILGGANFKTEVEDLRVTIPQEARLGLHWITTERLDLFAEVAWTQYSQLDDIDLKNEDPHEPVVPVELNLPIDLKDCWSFHGGFEFILSDRIKLRTGAFYATETAGSGSMDSLLFPSGTRYGFSGGVCIRFVRFGMDVTSGQNRMFQENMTGSSYPFPFAGDHRVQDMFIRIGMRWLF
ncbi:outer membrane protein transport protein [bacterium]|nr:outer membrane protein transport protein [candidate division CSSED10-310 bacterium]